MAVAAEDAYTGAMWLRRLGESLVGSSRPRPEPISGRRGPKRAGDKTRRVRTEDLLLALLAHGDGVASRILSDLGVDLEKAATATQHVLCPSPVSAVVFGFEAPAQWPPPPPSAT